MQLTRCYFIVIFSCIVLESFSVKEDNHQSVTHPVPRNIQIQHSDKVTNNLTSKQPDKKKLKGERFKENGSNYSPSLLQSPECGYDIRYLCTKHDLSDNLAILKCLQNSDKILKSISLECDHYLWSYKLKMTRDPATLSLAKTFCSEEKEVLKLCHQSKIPEHEPTETTGDFIGCLLSEKSQIRTEECHHFINKIASVVFSDYRMVKPLLIACEAHLQKLSCGRIPLNSHVNLTNDGAASVRSPTSQGRAIDCLVNNFESVNKTCRREILRLLELQSDDYHLDRRVFFACREERESVCGDVKAGNGRIYSCLTSNKFHAFMSKGCADELTKRQRISQTDYKINYGFSLSCSEDLEKQNCVTHFSDRNSDLDQTIGISAAIACLKAAEIKNGSHVISPDCSFAIKEVTKQLMQDYKVSPDIVTHCQHEIRQYCSKDLKKNGATLHCLMSLAIPVESDKSRLSHACYLKIKGLIQITEPVSDLQVDESVWLACRSIRNTYCQADVTAPPRMYACIQRHLSSSIISTECKQRFLEVAYIISRDFRLDRRLYNRCQKDAVNLCKATTNWLINDGSTQSPDSSEFTTDPGSHVFNCLFRHTLSSSEKNPSSACSSAIHEVLIERSGRVKLEPLLYEPCLKDLSERCINRSRYRDNELACLEDHYFSLTIDCQLAIRIYTSEQDKEFRLDPLITGPCGKYINKFCSTSELPEVMPCLIKYKNHLDMGRECRISIIHYQHLRNEDYRLSVAFYHACGSFIDHACPSMKGRNASLNAALDCITQYIDKTVSSKAGPSSSIPPDCKTTYENQMRLRFQETSRSSSDNDLQDVCLEDLELYCSNADLGQSRKIECLKKFRKHLTDVCHQFIFRREIADSKANRVDYVLASVCKKEITNYCFHAKDSRDDLLPCLRKAQLGPTGRNFDASCVHSMLEQLEINARDYKLDRPFEKACRLDILTHCRKIVDTYSEKHKAYDGRVKACIKEVYLNGRASSNKGLSERCKAAIRSVIVDTNLNYRLIPRFRDACSEDLTTHCLTQLEESMDEEAQRSATECLLQKIQQGVVKNQACLREAARAILLIKKADISADPELNRACSSELTKFCSSIEPGDGRQMECLMKIQKSQSDRKLKLGTTCRVQLNTRQELYFKVLHANPQTFEELASQIAASPVNYHIMAALIASVIVIFLLGTVIGCRGCLRNSKNVRYSRLKQSM